jgi:hypothetical protein
MYLKFVCYALCKIVLESRRLLMKMTFTTLAVIWIALIVAAVAQSSSFPPAVFTAKTVAIINDTTSGDVATGATNALRAWGQFKVVDDPDSADLTLRFDKSKEHQGQDTHKTDANGNATDYGYSMTFGNQIHMKAYVKGSETSFYTTKTDESKAKAGMSCVEDFRNIYRMAHP